MNDATPEPRQCRICGYPLDRKNRTGLCSNKTPACRKAREQLTAEEKPGKFRVIIKPGDTFGRWTALEEYTQENKLILCRCECATERRVYGERLTNSHSLSCGLCVKKRPRLPKEPYLKAGSVFGRLTLLEDAPYAHDCPRWRCEDGNEVTADAASVKFGRTKSCGCLHRETHTRHGYSKHPLSQIWASMIQRCTNPNNRSFHNYGGRGLAVCDRWRDLRLFIEDMEREIGPRPEGLYENGRSLYELDRIDNDGNYEPGNVQWSDRLAQMKNRRKVPELTQQALRLTGERDAALTRVAELEARLGLLASRSRKMPAPIPDISLF